MCTQHGPALPNGHEHGNPRRTLRFGPEVVREPGNDDADGGVCPACDAEDGKVARVRVRWDDEHDQVADRTEEARARDDEAARLEAIRTVGGTAEDDRGDRVGRNGKQLGERISCEGREI